MKATEIRNRINTITNEFYAKIREYETAIERAKNIQLSLINKL